MFFSGSWWGDVREFHVWHSNKPIGQWWSSKSKHWTFMAVGTWGPDGFSNADVWGIAAAE